MCTQQWLHVLNDGYIPLQYQCALPCNLCVLNDGYLLMACLSPVIYVY